MTQSDYSKTRDVRVGRRIYYVEKYNSASAIAAIYKLRNCHIQLSMKRFSASTLVRANMNKKKTSEWLSEDSNFYVCDSPSKYYEGNFQSE